MRILMVDDHPVVRQGLRQILAEAFPHAVFGEAATAQEALDRFRQHQWDVVILDICIPGRNGIEVLKELKQEQPRLPVLVLSIYAEDLYATRVLKAGADGYVVKDSAPAELVSAINRILQGRKYVSASLAEKLAAEIQPSAAKPLHEALSDREFEVLRLLAAGNTVKEIAETMSLSAKTVSTYRTRILVKLRLKTTSELIRYAIRHRLEE